MSIKTNIADYLTQIEMLTNTNLQILKTINDSFFTKQSHIVTEINDTKYVIPSFISLENKINMLQENFENLIKSPETSEAYFNFDGNTRSIEVRKYNHVPDSVMLPTVSTYEAEANNIFKDFMTPTPYVNFELPNIPNDIVEVNVKKIVAKSNALKTVFKNKLSYVKEEIGEDGTPVIKTYYNISSNESHANINKLLINYKKDIDYVEYDNIYKLPIRKNIGHATYVIESVVSDSINEMLEETIKLKLRNDVKDSRITNGLTYKLFDETIEKPLKIGDKLINFDGTGKVEILELNSQTNTIVVKVLNGEYLNFLGTDSYDTNNDTDIHDMSKLRFYEDVDFDEHKYVKVPLEDDQYIFVCVAPLNSRMNIQSSWGTGVIIDTYSLTRNNMMFNEYYKNNVKNIGDVLYEMTSMITSPITSISKEVFNALTSLKPELSKNAVSVMHINKHLNDSKTVKNIRNAYSQKQRAESDLSKVQSQIDEINNKLSNINFDDTVGTRAMYNTQLQTLNNKKSTLLKSISNAIDTIASNANSSETPLDNAKYHIRGFYVPDFENILGIDVNNHIIGIKVQYRYKNVSTNLGSAASINSVKNNKTYIYSDWNTLSTPLKEKLAKYNPAFDSYNYEYEENNEDKNEPSYNQIDIPISQGETVDIRLKVIYDYGQPYATMLSDWSNIINIEFPKEFEKDVPILTIIEENNIDIETYHFDRMLENSGVTSHIADNVIDQNITYYHKSDNIASGFFTDERRIIPLKDKLISLTNEIAQLKSAIAGSNENISVRLVSGKNITTLYTDMTNIMLLEGYNSISSNADGVYFKDDKGVVSTIFNISILNKGQIAMKLYPIFPGNKEVILNNYKPNSSYISTNGYCRQENEGVLFKYKSVNNSEGKINEKLQTLNQFITFRMNNVWTGEDYYSSSASTSLSNMQNSKSVGVVTDNTKSAMVVYPFLNDEFGLCVNSGQTLSYVNINPGEEVIIPMYCEFAISNSSSNPSQIEKTISFDIRNSLYGDPVNYIVKIIGKNELSTNDKLIVVNKQNLQTNVASSSKYNYIVK